MEKDGGLAVEEGWAVEQCKRVCCRIDLCLEGEEADTLGRVSRGWM